MMEIKNINNISSRIRSIYNKGIEAAEKNNLDYAIDLLKTIVITEPGFVAGREKLRSIEKKKLESKAVKIFLKSLKIKKLIKIGQLDLVRKKYKEAYVSAEEALAIDVRNLSALTLLAEVADLLEAPFIVIETYELAYEFYPENADVLHKLANTYRINKMGAKELTIRKKILQMLPNDIQARAELHSASAAAILEKHDLENKESSYREKLKDIDEAQILEQKERVIHGISDIQKLINKYENDLIDDPNSVVLLKKLGDLYQKSGVHSTAFDYFKKAENINDVFDITINRLMEKSELAIITNEIDLLSKTTENDSEELTEKRINLKSRLINIRETYAIKRINLYPNNLLLRYSLALIYFEKEEFDLAIEQFQISQENLQYHIPSLLFLGRCFMYKKQFDIAVEQFKKVVDELTSITDQKMEALYYLGIAYENINDSLNAMDCFKQIYSVQSTYKDIAERIQKYYE